MTSVKTIESLIIHCIPRCVSYPAFSSNGYPKKNEAAATASYCPDTLHTHVTNALKRPSSMPTTSAIGQPRLLLLWTVWSQTPLEPTYPPSIFLFHFLLNSSSIYPHDDIFLPTYPILLILLPIFPPHDDIPYVMYRPYKQQFAAYNPSLLVYIPSLASSRLWRTTPTSWSKTCA